MALLETLLILLVASALAGLAGSFLGIGGGIFLIPFMTLVLEVDLRTSIAVSLVGVIATSSGAASVYVRDHLTNLRLGMFLEIATTTGAIAGALVAVLVDPQFLYVTFAAVVLFAAVYMLRTPETARDRAYRAGTESPVAHRLALGSLYFDHEDEGVYRYRVDRPLAGFAVSAVAGGFAGLLGLGGGFVKVPAMNLLMRVPMKPAIATSNFMVGVTAAASGLIYYSRGWLDPTLAAVVIIGAFTGSNLGTKLMMRAKAERIRFAFAVFLAALGLLMALRAFGVEVLA